MYLSIYIYGLFITDDFENQNNEYLFANFRIRNTTLRASFLFLETEYREERKRKKNGEGGMGDP